MSIVFPPRSNQCEDAQVFPSEVSHAHGDLIGSMNCKVTVAVLPVCKPVGFLSRPSRRSELLLELSFTNTRSSSQTTKPRPSRDYEKVPHLRRTETRETRKDGNDACPPWLSNSLNIYLNRFVIRLYKHYRRKSLYIVDLLIKIVHSLWLSSNTLPSFWYRSPRATGLRKGIPGLAASIKLLR